MRHALPALAAASLLASACADSQPILAAAQDCTSCHGAPPATGAHLLHASPALTGAVPYGSVHVLEDVAPAGAPGGRYDFGCGHCHPLDAARHYPHAGPAGVAEVDLDPAGAPPGSLRARNAPGARWDPATGTCSGVSCHSSGQASPAYAATPEWTATAGALGCDGCHGNPPRYPSGGAGAADANSHLDLDLEVVGTALAPAWEFGHFAGLPGAAHTSKHGGGDPTTWGPGAKAAPITCQACHFETVDPENVLPGGAFYFDASGAYSVAGGLVGREASPSWQAMQCATCHAGNLGRGRVLPLRHVNGRRDVAFDVRPAIPAGPTGLALATSEPLRPYYMTRSGSVPFVLAPPDCAASPVPSCGVAADVAVREAVGGGQVLTLTLEHARYDPETKTCSSVACHLERQRQLDEGGGAAPLRWGAPYLFGDSRSCNGCHPR